MGMTPDLSLSLRIRPRLILSPSIIHFWLMKHWTRATLATYLHYYIQQRELWRGGSWTFGNIPPLVIVCTDVTHFEFHLWMFTMFRHHRIKTSGNSMKFTLVFIELEQRRECRRTRASGAKRRADKHARTDANTPGEQVGKLHPENNEVSLIFTLDASWF